MSRLLFVVVLLLGVPAVAHAQDDPSPPGFPVFKSYHQALRAINDADAFFAAFPVEAAAACQDETEQRNERGAQNAWTEHDYTCNKAVLIIAEIISLWTAGAFIPADIVVAWCVAAELVEIAKPVVKEKFWDRIGTERLPDGDFIRQRAAWISMDPMSRMIFLVINTTFAIVDASWDWHLP